MSKTKISIQTILRYLRDFSIVVAGIAVTLYVNDRIMNRSEKRDLKLYLTAVKIELEQNVKDIEEEIEILQQSINYAEYLKSHDKKSLNQDTINSYKDNYYLLISMTYKTNAFEMLKLSGTMRLMEDKELLLSIWETYTYMNDVKNLIDWGFQLKSEEIKKEIYWSKEEKMKNIPMYNFYTMTPWPSEMSRLCKEAIVLLNRTIEKLEKVL